MEELLSAYADGETTPAESRRVEAHVVDCRACGLRLAVLAKSKEALASLEVPAVPRDLKESLLQAAGQAQAPAQASPGPSWAGRLAAWRAGIIPRYGFALGLAAFLLVGLWFERSHEESVPLDVMLSAHRQYALARPRDNPSAGPAASGPAGEAPSEDQEDDDSDE